MTRLTIEMLPAAQGDALWVEWTYEGRTCRLLIDGGPGRSYPALRRRVLRLEPPAGTEKRIDLLTITHVDTDHIDGAVTLLLDDLGVSFGDIWFNGGHHVRNPLSPVAAGKFLGGAQGEVLSAILALPRFPWNAAFAGRAIVVDPARRVFPVTEIGGLTFTVLSPRVEQLQKLAGSWDRDVLKALRQMDLVPEGEQVADVAAKIQAGGIELARKLLAGRYPKRINPPPEWQPAGEDAAFLGDSSNPNGSSIAFLVENRTRELAVLFTGDAHEPVLFKSIVELLLLRGQTRLRLDALKLPHHGSRSNLSAALLAQLDCSRFLVSTDGSCNYDHPDDDAIELIVAEAARRGVRPELHFNYLSHRTKPWADPTRGNGTRYTASFPQQGEGEHGLVVTVGRDERALG